MCDLFLFRSFHRDKVGTRMSIKPDEAFRVLGLSFESERDLDNVTESIIKRQYRKLALKLHPDKNKDDPNAEVRFNQLKIAHDLMMDESKRRECIHSMKAQFQRQKEREVRDVEKRRLAEDLERRESEWVSSNTERIDVERFRTRHRALIEQLQAKRDEAKLRLQRAGAPISTGIGGPDDTNMSLDYWLNYGMTEDAETRRTKIERFSQFIDQKLSR